MYLRRQECNTVRAMQSLIRTLTGRRGLHMGDLGKGWLELCTEEDYQAAAGAACGAPRAQVEPPQTTEQAFALPCFCAAVGVVLLELSPDFDRRSQEMYQRLLRAQAA